MSVIGILIGLLNCVLLAAILVLFGAIIVWVASVFQWPIPWNIQRIFLLIVLLIFVICVISLLVGAPMVHFFPLAHGGAAPGAAAALSDLDRRIENWRDPLDWRGAAKP